AVLAGLGSSFKTPAPGVRVLPGFDVTAGAGTATLTGGDLPAATPTITRGVTLETTNRITVTGSTESLTLSVNLRTGLVTGSFKHPVTNRLVPFTGAALPKSSEIYGYFPGVDKNGALFVEPGP
ncbi:MAG TPA: hypothetical protein VGO11_10750, partial [Chthoniobacteraceae bacterium]|nr:hypothetical protein [Chthoniobacteraceae bacterium]